MDMNFVAGFLGCFMAVWILVAFVLLHLLIKEREGFSYYIGIPMDQTLVYYCREENGSAYWTTDYDDCAIIDSLEEAKRIKNLCDKDCSESKLDESIIIKFKPLN